ncbi:HIRAN domain-containing protein [Flavisolibacter tropicus]|uniref:HIRAN domain-containing protein n=1 Tax=Flavisolibacter tropicus TaxID=1492898 RepID=A0A172U283_9BACT|nr:HIRAN domain-containing protein [Flavisolibacter tropicus]ANE53143.1 hypothetical protein SY85_24390 [Flavisolibacter tropicus]
MIVNTLGLRHYKFKKPHIYDPVILITEPENTFDKKAVAVHNRQGEKMGYIAKEGKANEKVFKKLKQGLLIAEVIEVYDNRLVVAINFR